MIDQLVRIVANSLALLAAVLFVPGIDFAPLRELVARDAPPDLDATVKVAAVAIVFGLINSYIRPIVRLVSLPISLLTVGLFGFVINAAMLMLLALVSGQFGLGFTIDGWPGVPLDADVLLTAVIASVVISAVSTLIGLVRLVIPGI